MVAGLRLLNVLSGVPKVVAVAVILAKQLLFQSFQQFVQERVQSRRVMLTRSIGCDFSPGACLGRYVHINLAWGETGVSASADNIPDERCGPISGAPPASQPLKYGKSRKRGLLDGKGSWR